MRGLGCFVKRDCVDLMYSDFVIWPRIRSA
jgi:hypothetical protein